MPGQKLRGLIYLEINIVLFLLFPTIVVLT